MDQDNGMKGKLQSEGKDLLKQKGKQSEDALFQTGFSVAYMLEEVDKNL